MVDRRCKVSDTKNTITEEGFFAVVYASATALSKIFLLGGGAFVLLTLWLGASLSDYFTPKLFSMLYYQNIDSYAQSDWYPLLRVAFVCTWIIALLLIIRAKTYFVLNTWAHFVFCVLTAVPVILFLEVTLWSQVSGYNFEVNRSFEESSLHFDNN